MALSPHASSPMLRRISAAKPASGFGRQSGIPTGEKSLQDRVHQARPPVDQTGVNLHERRSRPKHLTGVLRAEDPSHADHRNPSRGTIANSPDHGQRTRA